MAVIGGFRSHLSMGAFHSTKISGNSGLGSEWNRHFPEFHSEILGVPREVGLGRDPFDQNFRKFWYKIKWNRTFLEIRFENCGQPLDFRFRFFYYYALFTKYNIINIYRNYKKYKIKKLNNTYPEKLCSVTKVA